MFSPFHNQLMKKYTNLDILKQHHQFCLDTAVYQSCFSSMKKVLYWMFHATFKKICYKTKSPVSVSWLQRPSFNSELSDFCCCYYRNVVWSESDVGHFNCRKVSNKTPIPVKSRKKYTRPGKSMSALLFVKKCMAFRNNLILLFYYQ